MSKNATGRVIEQTDIVHNCPRVLVTLNTVHFLNKHGRKNGRMMEKYLILKTKSSAFVSISARDTRDNLILVRHCRVVGGISIESVAGGREPGDSLAKTAIKELHEETGYKPGKLIRLNRRPVLTQTDRVRNPCVFFLASDCAKTSRRTRPDEVEELETVILRPEKFWQKVMEGKIIDMPTITGFLWAERYFCRWTATSS